MTARNARSGVSIDLHLGKAVVPAWGAGLETGGACVLFVLVLTRYNREEGFVNRCWIIVWKLGIKWGFSGAGAIKDI